MSTTRRPGAMTERLYAALLRQQSVHPYGTRITFPDLCAELGISRSGRAYDLLRAALAEIEGNPQEMAQLRAVLGDVRPQHVMGDNGDEVAIPAVGKGARPKDAFLMLFMGLRSAHARKLLLRLGQMRAKGRDLVLPRVEIEALILGRDAPLSVAKRLLTPAHRELRKCQVLARVDVSAPRNGEYEFRYRLN